MFPIFSKDVNHRWSTQVRVCACTQASPCASGCLWGECASLKTQRSKDYCKQNKKWALSRSKKCTWQVSCARSWAESLFCTSALILESRSSPLSHNVWELQGDDIAKSPLKLLGIAQHIPELLQNLSLSWSLSWSLREQSAKPSLPAVPRILLHPRQVVEIPGQVTDPENKNWPTPPISLRYAMSHAVEAISSCFFTSVGKQ